MFQSSPDPKAGRYKLDLVCHRVRRSSNPHPTRRPGATTSPVVPVALRLQFQSSPDPKAGRYAQALRMAIGTACSNPHPTRRPGATTRTVYPDCSSFVPILTRPEGRALQRSRCIGIDLLQFQSSPDPKAGRYSRCFKWVYYHHCSNPHPTRRPGATGSSSGRWRTT